MNRHPLITQARINSGLSQSELARLAGTSQPTLSAYEHGHKHPRFDVMERLIAASGHQLTITPVPRFTEHRGARGKPFFVANRLWHLYPSQALASVDLPLHLAWSGSPAQYDLANRNDRARVYEIVLREGTPDDLLTFIDGTLLLDTWEQLVLPAAIRSAWLDTIDHERSTR